MIIYINNMNFYNDNDNDKSSRNNQIIQIYTVGILKDEINELRKEQLQMRKDINEMINYIISLENKISNNDFEKKMINLNLNY